MLSIDLERLKADLTTIGRIGLDDETGGIYRPGFSTADMEARHAFLNRLGEGGIPGRMDPVGNVIGRIGPDDAPAVMIGSHLDTVPCGGLFDGALGAIAGMECLRCLREADIDLTYAVEVVGTAEEEGRFGGMLGGQSLTGTVPQDWLSKAADDSGQSLRDAMAEAGLDLNRIREAARSPSDLRAFLELHIEQGPVLEHAQIPVGAVDRITGCFNWQVTLTGKADHTGTTPMDMRRDALVGASEFIAGVDAMAAGLIRDGLAEQPRITVGRMDVRPGFPHTVPSETDFTIIARDTTSAGMDAMAAAVRKALEDAADRHNLGLSILEKSRLEPSTCAPSVVELIGAKATARGYDYRVMSCGAGHDVQCFANLCDAGLIFVPSAGGVSHSPDEWTDWADIEKGANVLLDTVLHLATGQADAAKAA